MVETSVDDEARSPEIDWMELTEPSRPRTTRSPVVRFAKAATAAGVALTTVYTAVLWNLALNPLRAALPNEVFSNFYDVQARALMAGHVDVPRGSLGIEGFVVRGKTFMYFPPGPSILRMPILAVTHQLDGRLTAPSLLLAWITTLVLSSLLIWRVRCMLRGDAPLPRWEAMAYGLLLAGMAGSVLLFLGSMPWVYHEAYAWAIPMSIGAGFSVLGILDEPRPWRVVWLGLFTLGAILSRTTTGWAAAGGALFCGVWLMLGRLGRRQPRLGLAVMAAGGVPLLIGVGFNWAKFRHAYLFPLQSQVWTGINRHRRDALRANHGSLFGLNMIASTAVAYFRPNGIRFLKIFPFITLPATPARSYGGAYLDQTYRTGSISAFMPGLLLLGMWGSLVSVWPRRRLRERPLHRRATHLWRSIPRSPHVATLIDGSAVTQEAAPRLRLAMLGSFLVPFGILFYGYIAYRYTCEFLPFLLFASAVGLVDLTYRLRDSVGGLRLAALITLAALVAFGTVANAAVALTTERLASPGPSLDQYLSTQAALSWLSGGPLGHHVRLAESVPTTAKADELLIVGDCDEMLVGTGEPLNPWVVAAARTIRLRITRVEPKVIGPLAWDSEATIAEIRGHTTTKLVVERLGELYFRLAFEDSRGKISTLWFSPRSASFDVTISMDRTQGLFVIRSPGPELLRVPNSSVDKDWLQLPTRVLPVPLENPDVARFQVQQISTPAPLACRRVQDSL